VVRWLNYVDHFFPTSCLRNTVPFPSIKVHHHLAGITLFFTVAGIDFIRGEFTFIFMVEVFGGARGPLAMGRRANTTVAFPTVQETCIKGFYLSPETYGLS